MLEKILLNRESHVYSCISENSAVNEDIVKSGHGTELLIISNVYLWKKNDHKVIQVRKEKIKFFPLFLVAACGLSLVAESRGYSLFGVCRLLIVVASLFAEYGP